MYIVFDIGGTNMRISSSDGKSILQTKIVPVLKDFNEALISFKNVASELTGTETVEAIAGGIPGPLDKEKTMLISSPHLPNWVNKPLKDELNKAFDCPVYLENDSVMGALGESTNGAGKGYPIVAYIASGTGVGGAKIVDGKIDKNSLGFQPGHQIIVPDGNPCDCGGKGHLEAYIGGAYIEKIYGKKGENINDPNIWDEVSKYLAFGLYNTIVHWSPDIIVLGGAVTQSIPLDRVEAHLKEIQTIFPTTPKIVKATLGSEAGAYGALAYINQSK